MRKPLLPILVLMLVCNSAIAQINAAGYIDHGNPFIPITQMTGEEEFRRKYNTYFDEYSVIVKGKRVLGTPWLVPDWMNGSLTTPDNRVYTIYKLKYDALNQAVFFLNGKDSLEVNEDIKEFSLTIKAPDTTIVTRFISSNQYQTEKKAFYYEVIIDNSMGQLLKTNQKVVTEASNGLPAYDGKKVLAIESEYFYYDKASKKLIKIKVNGSNLKEVLKPEVTSQIDFTKYIFNNEDDLNNFFLKYFELAK